MCRRVVIIRFVMFDITSFPLILFITLSFFVVAVFASATIQLPLGVIKVSSPPEIL